MTEPTVTRWSEEALPTSELLDTLLREEDLAPRWWSNGPGDTYATHEHGYRKVLYCARGSITFATPAGAYELTPGDRLELPAGTPHSAVVGDAGVECVESALREDAQGAS